MNKKKKKTEINNMDDTNLQLRYYLGGLELMSKNKMCDYWRCDINCSCSPVLDDDRLTQVKEFIKKHNLTNNSFIRIAYSYLAGSIMKYKGEYSPFFIELDSVLESYNFTHEEIRSENDFREKELEELVKNNSNEEIKDFISLAKTSINYNYYVMRGLSKKDECNLTTDVSNILNKHELYVSKEYIQNYKEEHKKNHKNTELIVDTKLAQKKYLELLKELLEKDPDNAIDLITEDLNDLTLNLKNVKGIQKSLRKLYIK